MKEGALLELTIEALERFLAPDATVKSNVELPVLNSQTGRTAQCDVVIRTGTPPRETITIVEVQDRNSQVAINDFRGWIGKMREVGAQHLICVSRHEFPSSIKEIAFEQGNSVRLIRLHDDIQSLPENFFNTEYSISIQRIQDMVKPEIDLKKDFDELYYQDLLLADINEDDKIIYYGEKVLSIKEIINDVLRKNPKYEGRFEIRLTSSSDKELKILHNKKEFPISSFYIQGEVKREIIKFSLNVLTYEQSGFGALGWVLEGEITIDGKPLRVKAPVVQQKDGSHLIEFIIENENLKEGNFILNFRYEGVTGKFEL